MDTYTYLLIIFIQSAIKGFLNQLSRQTVLVLTQQLSENLLNYNKHAFVEMLYGGFSLRRVILSDGAHSQKQYSAEIEENYI